MNPVAATVKQEWRRGGTVVLGSHLAMSVGAGLYFFVSSLFVIPLSEAFDWSRGTIASAAAIGALGTLSAPLIGKLTDRFGARRVACVSLFLLGLTFVGMSQMSGPFRQFLIFSAIFGLIAPGCAAMTYSSAITGWFMVARGQALGVMAAGVSVGALAFAPLISWALSTYGFEGGYLTLSALAFGVGLPAVAWGVREKSHLNDENEDTASWDLTAPVASQARQNLRETLRSRSFLALAAAVFATNAPGAGVLTQLDPILTHNGVRTPELYIAVFSFAVLVGRIGIGWTFDNFEPRRVAAFFSLIAIGGCLLLLSGASISFAFLAIVLVGLLQGMEVDVIGFFVARQFDREHFGLLFGILLTISMLGTALGVVGFGMLYDRTQSYDAALLSAAVILAGAAIAYLWIPARTRV